MTVKKFLALVLVLMLALPCAAAFAEDFTNAQDYTRWSQWPVANGDVKVEIAIPLEPGYGIPADETWFWPYFEEVTGIDFEITQIQREAIPEQKNLMFASGDLPDVLFGIGLSTDELVRYGVEEGLLLDMKPYINEDVMPNLLKLAEYYPDILAYITASDGGVYSLAWLWDNLYGEETRSFISETRMTEAGITAVPQTLDDFVAALYAMKDAAAEEDFIALGGSWAAWSPIYYILNAMGFVGNAYNNGTGITVRDGKAVIPATDPLFYEALTLLKQFYADGIIDPDFFSIDQSIVDAKAAEDKYGVYPWVPMTVRPDDKEWEWTWSSVSPLTSEWNDTKAWKATNPIYVGGFVMSAECENPEIILRAFDALFAYEGFFMAYEGPVYGSKFAEEQGRGGRGAYINEEGNYTLDFYTPEGEHIEGNTYRFSVPCGEAAYSLGNNQVWFDNPGKETMYISEVLGMGAEQVIYNWESFEGDPIDVPCVEDWRASMYHYVHPYAVTAYPSIVYRSADDTLRINEIESVLTPYIESAIAQFIVGDRPLDEAEFAKYMQEIEDMGASELNAIYDSYYQAYLANIG